MHLLVSNFGLYALINHSCMPHKLNKLNNKINKTIYLSLGLSFSQIFILQISISIIHLCFYLLFFDFCLFASVPSSSVSRSFVLIHNKYKGKKTTTKQLFGTLNPDYSDVNAPYPLLTIIWKTNPEDNRFGSKLHFSRSQDQLNHLPVFNQF